MRVKLRLFAQLRDAAGTGELELDLPRGARAADAATALAALVPGLDASGAMVAVNHAYARPDAALADGDVVALLPPVAGG